MFAFPDLEYYNCITDSSLNREEERLMKILYSFFHNYSSMPYHTREWIEAAIELGHKVRVVTAIDPVFLETIGWNGNIDIAQVAYPGTKGLKKLILLKNHRQTLADNMQSFKPDIVYERFSFISAAMASISARFPVPYCIELNGIPNDENALAGKKRFIETLMGLLQLYAYRRADRMITVTGRIRDWAIAEYGIDSATVKYLPNGVNIERFKPFVQAECRREFSVPEDAFAVGYLGSLFPWQDIDMMIDLAPRLKRRIPELYFLVGGGQEPLWSELKEKTEAAGVKDYFRLLGQIHWDKAARFISCFDVAVSPLKHIGSGYELSPQKVAAYLACGIPLIAADMPGEINNIFSQADVGMKYKTENSASFEECLLSIYRLPPGHRARMGKNGRDLVLKKYTWKQIVSNTLEFAGK